MSTTDSDVPTRGLVHAFALDGRGGGRPLSPAEAALALRDRSAGQTVDAPDLWLHVDRMDPGVPGWLDLAGVPPHAAEALLAEETRPRADRFADGLVVNLRGLNVNPGMEASDLISVRAWTVAGLTITTRRYPLRSTREMAEALTAGSGGPRDSGGVIADLADRLVGRLRPEVDRLEDLIDDLEDEALAGAADARPRDGIRKARAALAELRRETIAFRRYMAPQREALMRLAALDPSPFGHVDRLELRETADQLTRMVEDLDAIRERTLLAQGEWEARIAERTDRTVYLLTILSSVMLPLGFITGLLGVNVAGIPGAEDPAAFLVLCVLLGLLVAVQFVLYRRLRWI
ncbi:zinc transporter ZntB [Tistrella mobilis]|uniref:zinc transporter ZntB n=1 Tax=Tistrella mobilis TaxID=171437 RepID=UPI0035570BBD